MRWEAEVKALRKAVATLSDNVANLPGSQLMPSGAEQGAIRPAKVAKERVQVERGAKMEKEAQGKAKASKPKPRGVEKGTASDQLKATANVKAAKKRAAPLSGPKASSRSEAKALGSKKAKVSTQTEALDSKKAKVSTQAQVSGSKRAKASTQSPPSGSVAKAVEGKILYSKLENTKSPDPAHPATSKTSLKKSLLPKDPKAALKKVQDRRLRLAKLQESDPAQAKAAEDKDAWAKAIAKAQGVAVRDDARLLKKSIARREKHKESSKKKWNERQEKVVEEKIAKQRKRRENLENRKSAKKGAGKITRKGGPKDGRKRPK